MREFESKFSGNVIEICPVGALTNAKYRFRARPWDLQTRPAICTLCSNGCSIYMDYRANQIVRINGRTHEAVNEEWTCDRGKFGHDVFNGANRTKYPHLRSGDRLQRVEWGSAYATIADALKGLSGTQMAVLAGGSNSNESLYVLQRLFRGVLGSENLDSRFAAGLPKEPIEKQLGLPTTKSTIASLEWQKAVLLFGTSLADEEPILFLRLRKGWFNRGTKVVVASDGETDADSFANFLLRYRPGTAATLALGLATAAGTKGSDARYTPAHVESVTGVRASEIVAAAALIKELSAPVIATRNIYDSPDGQAALEALAGFAANNESAFNLYSIHANDQGAEELGFLPGSQGLNTKEILEKCASGEIKLLWLVGVDPLSAFPDRSLVEAALEKVNWLIVQDAFETESSAYASVLLPATAPSESDGTYTNMERRVQRSNQVLPALGEAKPVWRAITELALRLKPETPSFNASEVMDRIAREVPAFAEVSYAALGDDGIILT